MSANHYSKSTRRGIVIFTILMVVLFILPDLIQFLREKPPIKIEQWDEVEQQAVAKVNTNFSSSYRNKKRKQYFLPPAKFNPNEYTLEEWKALGLSDKQSAAILKFLKYPVYSNDDLKRIVIIPEQLFELIKDSTIYPPKPGKRDSAAEYQLEQKLIVVDVNAANLKDILRAREITYFDAKQILRKRDELGGFYSEDQLAEVWQSTPEKIAVWKKYLVINPHAVRKIDINDCSVNELANHPYISWNLANSLVKLRIQNGPYQQIEDTKKSVLMSNELFEKVKPYFKIEQ